MKSVCLILGGLLHYKGNASLASRLEMGGGKENTPQDSLHDLTFNLVFLDQYDSAEKCLKPDKP